MESFQSLHLQQKELNSNIRFQFNFILVDPNEHLCPYGWINRGDSCYFDFKDEFEMTFFEATVRCFHHRAFPTTISDPDELLFASELTKNPTWLGVTNLVSREDDYSGLDGTTPDGDGKLLITEVFF